LIEKIFKLMNLILIDDNYRDNLLPLVYTRPVAELLVGIIKISEKWERVFTTEVSFLTQKYLAEKFPLRIEQENLIINGSICPSPELIAELNELSDNQILMQGERFIALKIKEKELNFLLSQASDSVFESILKFKKEGKYSPQFSSATFESIVHLWDIFTKNGQILNNDFRLLTDGRKSEKLSASNKILGDDLFVEEGVKAECAIFNTTTGPIYLGKNAEIMEGSIIRGPFALGEGGGVKLGTKIYGPTTVGPYSKVGGELNNSVLFAYSNKGHDGFLGNSVLGEWCNLGADTNNSNLKNNYGEVQIWNYKSEKYINTGLQFCGLIMGDHSKCGINTMFNTGTVVGVNANIFGAGFPSKYIPSFSWGGEDDFVDYDLEKALLVAKIVYSRRNKEFDKVEKDLLSAVFQMALHEKDKLAE
jgi:UDP-N-acetylglucosamine diphosphorylase/glucosamine-1-phosphate N-acetyltransferase